ncbi:hypothetical protein N0V83_002091 [Neocucurbitaria cava]|uniref:Uncharacterized protein n=1 Tax=Neocucurbitaria cava TaxID=798079 RepID=A0A9W8YDQ3_9PLEO|nr:hypothetical protein N0V83_002091 [Neocucurbitaria cava]
MAPTQAYKGTRPTLLTLPGELRNRIYRYALSCDTLKVILPWEDKPKPRPSFNSRLRPPFKSRSAVSKLTLMDAAVDDIWGVVEFNQLKFACRQLYAETAGLELQFNNIRITRRWGFENEAGKQFLQIADQVKGKEHWLSGSIITLEDVCSEPRSSEPAGAFDHFFPDTSQTIAKIGRWCRQHASVRVDVNLTPVDLCGRCENCLRFLMTSSAALAHILWRGQGLIDVLPSGLIPIALRERLQIMDSWVRQADTNDLQVPTLRFRPPIRKFNDKTIKGPIAQLAVDHPEWKDVMEEKWPEQVKRWVEDGI